MQLLTVKNKAKSDHSKKINENRPPPKSFLEVIQSETIADITTLDTNTGELEPLQMMIVDLYQLNILI